MNRISQLAERAEIFQTDKTQCARLGTSNKFKHIKVDHYGGGPMYASLTSFLAYKAYNDIVRYDNLNFSRLTQATCCTV